MRHPILECHPSDHSGCLARLHAEVVDGIDTAGAAAKTGTAVHRVAEAIVFEVAEHPAVDQREIATRTLHKAVRDLDMPPASVVDALRIIDKVLAYDSRISLHGEPGWSSRPEVKWALDVDLVPYSWVVEPMSGEGSWRDDDGNGVAQDRILAAGTIDLLQWLPDQSALKIVDWKTERSFRDADDAYEDFQARVYVLAMFQQYPAAQTIEFAFGMLRHGYMARAEFLRGEAWAVSTERQLRADREQRERALAAKSWPETPGPWCSWCGLILKCKALAAVVEQGDAVAPDLPHAEQIRRWKALTRLADSYEELARAPFQDPHHDAPVHLGDAKGTHFGWKDTAAWVLVNDYETTIRLVRELIPDEAWPTVFAENFRFVTEGNLPSRVSKVLKDLKATDDVRDRIVLPIVKPMLTTFRPEVARPGTPTDGATAEQLDAFIDEMLGRPIARLSSSMLRRAASVHGYRLESGGTQ